VDLSYGAPKILRLLLDYFQIFCALALWSVHQSLIFSNRMYHRKVSFAREYDSLMVLMLTLASQETFVTRSGVIALPYID
jgi:hypothetical protein